MASFGETLKRERELREISLRQIAEATKINIRYLEALEENRFDALPGGLFNKGFIRAYSTFIGVDGEAMVNSYLQQIGPLTAGPAVPRPDLGQRSMHRPAGVPQKRAGARPADSSASPSQRPARPAITFASTPAPAGAPASSASAPAVDSRADLAPAAALHSPPADPVRAALQAIASDRTEKKKTEGAGERSSRALFWILSLVAAAGVLFLLMSVLRPAPPAASRPAESPATESGGASVPAEGAVPAPQEGAETQPDGSSALLPEMSQPSHITLGALTSVAPSGAPNTSAPRPQPTPRTERASVPPPPAVAPSGPGERADAGSAEPRPPETGPMKVEIQTSDRAFVQLVCDGREVVNRVMEAGELEEARCDAVVRVSATDAGAVRVIVNGAPCLPLGDPGSKAYGYTIRVDDFARICPRGERGSRGRR
jgi:cytoskeletal protein RodZ